MKYGFMERYGSGFEVRRMCRVLGVSRSGYYSYLRRGLSPGHEENKRFLTRIKEIWAWSRGIYGSPRITAELRAQGLGCGENRIARLMRENGIKARTRKKFKITTRSDHDLPIAEDLVERDFSASGINELWLSDITYIWTWEGWMYLSAVMEVYNRQIVGWALYDRLSKRLVVDALLSALHKRCPQPGLIFHSDRGSQYASSAVKKILKAWHVNQSMSDKGNCFDNAMMESLFSSLKKELVHLMTFHSKDQARRAVFEYIEIFYNRQRRHSALNQKSPLEYYQDATQT
jgi:transposase InsO family protein